MAENEIDIEFEDIVAAVSGDSRALSEAEIQIIDKLLDSPEINEAERREFIEMLNTIVVCIIDHHLKATSSNPVANICEQLVENDGGGNEDAVKLLYSEVSQLTETYRHASNHKELKGG